SKLEEKYNEAVKSGKKVIAVVGNACSTATGSYDNLNAIADFCEKYNLWFHVDGAHGASALISDKYKQLLKGVERADSIIWDAHKMMLVSALVTAVIFKDGDKSYNTFSQQASYVFEKEGKEEWYNLCHRTMECTKTLMILKVYCSLSDYGTKLFSDYIDYTYDLTKQFAKELEKQGNFELATEPQSNIICFRYTGNNSKDLNTIQKEIRKEIHKTESFYTTQTELNNKSYIRCTIINPHTTMKEIRTLIETIQTINIT
ncbi:MAG: aspartate aminotransferase family protein, partial [Vampirovibrionia bacterium]